MIYDVIVIGSGVGGSVVSLRKYLWIPALRFFGFQKLTFFSQASILSGVGAGGGSLVYANTLYVPPDEFFKRIAALFRNLKKNGSERN